MTARRRSIAPVVVGLLAAALIALLGYGVLHGGDNNTLDDAVKAGKRPDAPSTTLKRPLLDENGERSLADYKGQIVVLNFWASWCDPCIAEAPLLEHAQQQLVKAHLGTVLGATYDDPPSHSRKFEREQHITYPSVRDVGADLARKFGTNKLPETFVLDREGRVVAISRGQVSRAFLDNALLKAQQAPQRHGGDSGTA